VVVVVMFDEQTAFNPFTVMEEVLLNRDVTLIFFNKFHIETEKLICWKHKLM